VLSFIQYIRGRLAAAINYRDLTAAIILTGGYQPVFDPRHEGQNYFTGLAPPVFLNFRKLLQHRVGNEASHIALEMEDGYVDILSKQHKAGMIGRPHGIFRIINSYEYMLVINGSIQHPNRADPAALQNFGSRLAHEKSLQPTFPLGSVVFMLCCGPNRRLI
jgi:hypothetical protein